VGDFEKLAGDLVELQSQVAFQEDMMSSLNEALTEQQREVLLLRRQVELLKQRLEEQALSSDSVAAPAGHERPPHY
jgi:SlyX protein